MHFLANIFVRTVLADLLYTSCHNCIQLTTLWRATISNTVMGTLQDFFSSKVKFIYTSTVTRSHSCYRKNYGIRLAYILFANIFVRTVLTDLLHTSCQYNCIQLTTLWRATISNTVMYTLHDFFSSKVRFIHTSTVTRSHSCYGKKLRVRLAYILFKELIYTFVAVEVYVLISENPRKF